jgi:hypothetical protein
MYICKYNFKKLNLVALSFVTLHILRTFEHDESESFSLDSTKPNYSVYESDFNKFNLNDEAR